VTNSLEDFGFLAFTLAFAPEDAVVEAVHRQLSEWWRNGIRRDGSLQDLKPFQLKKEYNPESKRVAIFLIKKAPSIVLIESNLIDGYASLVHMVSSKLTDSTFLVIRSKPVGKNEWPLEEFDLMRGGPRGRLRHVWVALDADGWKYSAEGEPQAFEEPNRYKERSIKNRLTRPQILRYVARLGIDLEDVGRGRESRLLAIYSEASAVPGTS
jgi:hypothetical protein